LQNNTFEVTLYQSYATSETEATIYGLVGIQTTIEVSPSAAGLATPSATAPKYTLTGTYLKATRQLTQVLANYRLSRLHLLAVR
jgi:hypothetical protein